MAFSHVPYTIPLGAYSDAFINAVVTTKQVSIRGSVKMLLAQGHTASLRLEPTLPTPTLPAFPL